jgi:hypothetical protein
MNEYRKPFHPRLKRKLDERLYDVLSSHQPQDDPSPPAGSEESLRVAQKLSGGRTERSPRNHPYSPDQIERVKNLVRPNVQEVVGVAWAEYQLHGSGSAGVVDWITEALTSKIASNPEFFYGGDEDAFGSYGGSE